MGICSGWWLVTSGLCSNGHEMWSCPICESVSTPSRGRRTDFTNSLWGQKEGVTNPVATTSDVSRWHTRIAFERVFHPFDDPYFQSV